MHTFRLISIALLVACCLPAVRAQQPAGKAPKIPLPTGNVRSKSPAPGEAPKIQIGKADKFTLDNGLTVIVVENHKLPRVSYQLFVDVDPALEGAMAGKKDLFGDMLAKGTRTRTKAQIDESIDFIGASMSASASGVSGSCLTRHTDKLLEIMADVVLNPTFPDDEFDKSKKRSESGLQAAKDNADAIAGRVGNVLRYGTAHPYGESMSEETLANIKVESLRTHHLQYFKPGRSYLVCVGDITRATAERQARAYFGQWASGNVPGHVYDTPKAPAQTQVDFVHKPAAVQSVINITYPVDLKPGTPDAIPASVMNTILGGYFNSRINANLREGKAYTYGARSTVNPDERVGYFNAGASVRNEVTDSAIVEFMRELRRMQTEPVPESELQVVKNVLTGNFSSSLEQPGTIARFALNTARYKLPEDYYEKYLQRVQEVTARDVQRMANTYIQPNNAHILVVGNKDEVADKLKVFSPTGKVNYYDSYGRPLEDKRMAIPPGVTAQKVVDDYVQAIGGAAAIAKIKDMETKSSIAVGPGMSLAMRTAQKDNAKIVVEMTMNGQTLNKSVFDGNKGVSMGQGGVQVLEGKELQDIKEQAHTCKEMLYNTKNYTLNLKGIDQIDGKNAYVLQVKRTDGKETTEYYDMQTGLKLREITVQEQGGQSITLTNDYANYKSVGGIKVPHEMTISGAMPIPLKAVVSEVKVNQGLKDAVFSTN
jgi:zinc protease